MSRLNFFQTSCIHNNESGECINSKNIRVGGTQSRIWISRNKRDRRKRQVDLFFISKTEEGPQKEQDSWNSDNNSLNSPNENLLYKLAYNVQVILVGSREHVHIAVSLSPRAANRSPEREGRRRIYLELNRIFFCNRVGETVDYPGPPNVTGNPTPSPR